MKINQQAIEEIIRQVLAKLQEKPKLLLVYENKENTKKLEYLISKLQEYWQVEVFSTADNSLYELSDIQNLAFLDVSQDLLVRGALGLTDTPGSNLLAKALHRGCMVLFEPSDELQWLVKQKNKVMPERVQRYRAQLLKYKNLLIEFGVWFGGVDALRPSQLRYDRRVLTEKDIQKIKSTEIHVSPKTIITSLAMDTARERGIQIRVDFEGQS
jgi:hypothetical protein